MHKTSLPMNAFWSFIQNWYHRMISSIAFLPALMTLSSLLLAFSVITVEYDELIINLKERIKYLLITNREEARLVLGTLVASIISLMVFSFSMVMIVLSRASSNLSPRVLPGLISNKTHQFILGLYLGTIIFTLIVIINFQKEGDYRIPSLGVLIAMGLGITCLWLFIYFIHSISQNIQVENILEEIFKRTRKALRKISHDHPEGSAPIAIDGSWLPILTDDSGYIVRYNTDALVEIASKEHLQVAIMQNATFFFVEGYPFLRVKGKSAITDETIKAIKQCFLFSLTDQLSEHYLYGFRQISEIATKALSPGINDPGTALKALDHLSLLFIERIKSCEPSVSKDKSGVVRVVHSIVTFEELLLRNLIPIREFSKSDVLVQLRILSAMKNLLIEDVQDRHAKIIISFIASCVESADENIGNTLDRAEVNKFIATLSNYLPGDFRLRALSNKARP